MLVESSQAHAADEYIYVDLGTSAGSRVDGQPADEQTLHTGDRIELGHWTLSFSGRSSPTMAGPTADGRAAKGPPSGRKRSRALVGPPPTAAVTGKAPTPASTSSRGACHRQRHSGRREYGRDPPCAIRDPRPGRWRPDGQRLAASLTFAPACFMLPFTRSPRPSARRRLLPVSRPALLLTLPLTVSALCASFLGILMENCLSLSHPAGADAPAGTSGTGAL